MSETEQMSMRMDDAAAQAEAELRKNFKTWSAENIAALARPCAIACIAPACSAVPSAANSGKISSGTPTPNASPLPTGATQKP